VDGIMVPKTRAVVRYDNQTVLGVVSDRYVPVQAVIDHLTNLQPVKSR
jgi:hypothetical protein